MITEERIKKHLDKDIKSAEASGLLTALIKSVSEISKEKKKNDKGKKLYYISAEFLIGKLLINNLINLGLYNETEKILNKHGRSLNELEELEAEPSLGNGGLGRLASCFLDSAASLGLNADGIGLNYRFGLFRQSFENNSQKELPDPWINNDCFLTDKGKKYKVHFKDFSVTSKLYGIDITGYRGKVNTLHLFEAESVDEKCVKEGILYDKTNIRKNLTLFLYPDDSDKEGKRLRIYQQYFMVSSAAQLILDEFREKKLPLTKLHENTVIQINDTHPALIIPEMIRLLNESGLSLDEAIDEVTNTCAYTNHTILSEALEKWELSELNEIVPHLIPIIKLLDERIKKKTKKEALYIIDSENRVHMARICIHYGFSVNGVAELHTKILKETELKDFHIFYPGKFNNKTNGITFRRWLFKANPILTEFIFSLIGEEFKTDHTLLEKLSEFKDDSAVLEKLTEIKTKNKNKLCDYLKKTDCFPEADSIFDIQIKRFHEYKRQQLNAIYIIDKYLEIKEGKLPKRPITFFFGGKAAPAYTIAKDIIHLILCLQKIINNDSSAKEFLKIVFPENYNVSLAERLIPACDISQQISLASKEASGTGNMKFMLNGAVTCGTPDGANVEIRELVGDENIYIFGDDSKTVIERYKRKDYSPSEYIEKNPSLKRAVDFITSDTMLMEGESEYLHRLKNELTSKDWFMTFPDFEAFKNARNSAYEDYEKRISWAKKMLTNIAYAGFFSSDRTVNEYNKEIWKL